MGKRNKRNNRNKNRVQVTTQTLPEHIPLKRNMKKKMFFGVLAFACTVLSATYTPLTDIITGRFFDGRISLGIGDTKVSEKEPIYVFFTTPNRDRDAKYLVPIQLSVFNEFESYEEDVSLSIKYNKENGRSIFDENIIVHSGHRTKSELIHELNSSKEYDYSIYKIKYLTKQGNISVTDAAFTSKVNFHDRIPVLFEMGQELNLEVTTYSKRDIQRVWDFRYSAINVRNKEDLIVWVKEFYGKSIALDLRRDLSFFQYLKGLVFGKDITIYGFEPKFNYVPEQNLYIPEKKSKSYQGYNFNPYVFSLLFDFEWANKS